jgi:hypothetical protein
VLKKLNTKKKQIPESLLKFTANRMTDRDRDNVGLTSESEKVKMRI